MPVTLDEVFASAHAEARASSLCGWCVVDELWSDFTALWSWAFDEGGVTPLILALVITVFIVGLVAAGGYGIWLTASRGAEVVARFGAQRRRRQR